MSRMRGLATLIAAIVVIAGTVIAPSTASAATTVVISGHVSLGSTAVSATTDEVGIYYRSFTSGQPFTSSILARTDAAGDYRLTVQAGSRYELHFVYLGSGSYLEGATSNTNWYLDPALLQPTADLPGVDITLAPGSQVVGRLVDGTGAPLSGSTYSVRALAYDDPRSPNPTRIYDGSVPATDGSFSIRNLPPGDYRVEYYSSRTGLHQYVGETAYGVPFATQTVGAQSTLDVGALTVLIPVGVTGTVNCARCTGLNNPRSETVVELQARPSSAAPWSSVRSDFVSNENGYFQFSVLVPGVEYRVAVVYTGRLGYLPAFSAPFRAVAGVNSTLPEIVMISRPMADLSGDGWADVLARDTAGGLYLYSGNGAGGWLSSARIGTGWNGFNRVFRVGDFTSDGCADLAGRTPSGDLYLYRGDCAGGWLGASRIGTGWGIFTEIFGTGDFDGDGNADVMARTGSGDLYVYRGNGSGGWAGSSRIGTGWNGFSTVFGAGDFSGDGRTDVMARTPGGDLYLYRGDGAGGWSGSGRIGTGWGVFTAVLSPGDFSGDGVPDVLGRTAGGDLFLYRGNGSGGWGTSGRIGTGWGPLGLVS